MNNNIEQPWTSDELNISDRHYKARQARVSRQLSSAARIKKPIALAMGLHQSSQILSENIAPNHQTSITFDDFYEDVRQMIHLGKPYGKGGDFFELDSETDRIVYAILNGTKFSRKGFNIAAILRSGYNVRQVMRTLNMRGF